MDGLTAAFDPNEMQMIAELIRALKCEGIAIVMIRHDLRPGFDMSDRISAIKYSRHGRTGSTSEAKNQALQMTIPGNQPDSGYALDIGMVEDA